MGGADNTQEALIKEITALRQQMALRSQSVLQHVSDIAFITDEQGTIVYANPNAGAFFGSPPEGKPVSSLVGDAVFDLDRLKAAGELSDLTCKDNTLNIKLKYLAAEQQVLFICQKKITSPNIVIQIEDRLLNSTIAIAILDIDGNYLFLNKQAARNLGGQVEDFNGKSLFDVFPKDVAQTYLESNRKVIESGIGRVYEVETDLPAGKRTLLVSEQAIKGDVNTGDADRGIAYQHTSFDITELRTTEKAIRENNEMLELILKHFPGYISWKDRNSVYLGANQALARLAGVPDVSHLIGKTHFDFFEPIEDVRRWQEDDRQAIENDTIVHTLSQLKDGAETLWVSVYKIPLHDNAGQVVGLLAVTIDITQIQVAHQLLEESRWQYQTLFDTMLDGYALYEMVCDAAGNPINFIYLDINQSYERVMGRSRDIIGKYATDILPQNEYHWIETFGNVALKGHTLDTEFYSKEFDKWFRVMAFRIRHGQLAAVFHETTQKRQAELALLHEKELLHALMDNITDSIYFKDRQSRFIRINKAQAEYLGVDFDDEQIIGKTDFDFLPQEHAQRAFEDEQHLLTTGKPIIDKVEKIHDGAWVSATKVPIRDADGQITGLVGISRNITERMQAEELLRESESRFRQLAENIEQVFWLSSGDWQELLYVSPAYEKVWGRSCESLMTDNDSWLESIVEEDRGRIAARNSQLNNTESYVLEYRIMRPDGTIRWIASRDFPIKDENGVVYRYAGVAEDITTRKETEQELYLYRQQLEELVGQRTLELLQANQELQQLANIKDQFVSNISHELRTPLTSLKLRRHLISQAQKDEAIDDHLEVLGREIQRLDGLISNLLLLSRLDQDRVVLNAFYVNLNAIVQEYVKDRIPLAERQGVSLSYDVQDDLPLVRADRGMIGQVLSILLTNAINYTPEGGQIIIKTHHKEKQAGFSVNDTGPGIPPEEHEAIFTRFYRGNTTRSSAVVGTGLGLAIAREIIDRHKGEITIQSEGIPGKGTSFFVWLSTS